MAEPVQSLLFCKHCEIYGHDVVHCHRPFEDLGNFATNNVIATGHPTKGLLQFILIMPDESKGKSFLGVSAKLSALPKESLLERQKAEAEAKRVREKAETPAVYEEFVKSFEDEDSVVPQSLDGGSNAFRGRGDDLPRPSKYGSLTTTSRFLPDGSGTSAAQSTNLTPIEAQALANYLEQHRQHWLWSRHVEHQWRYAGLFPIKPGRHNDKL
ncbi:unnamed protein product [Penicillium camemberti]|uniref:Str. FM013 n=1 Tax=Penicillium camemberti (strain FM 013) TaxID=1429867 RepID=A0A0G4PG15_PENC3|nr:unnamed protein product [Penicillium camemberti]